MYSTGGAYTIRELLGAVCTPQGVPTPLLRATRSSVCTTGGAYTKNNHKSLLFCQLFSIVPIKIIQADKCDYSFLKL